MSPDAKQAGTTSEWLARDVRRELAELGGVLASLFAAPLVTALVVDAEDAVSVPGFETAMLEVRDALERVGVPRGRQFVLVGGRQPEPAHLPAARRDQLRERLALPVLVHDPAGPSFTAGRLGSGTPIELDDELREAEAIVCAGSYGLEPAEVRGGPYLLVPGVASLATRRALAAERARAGERAAFGFALAAEVHAPVDLAVLWGRAGDVIAGPGRALFSGLAERGGFA